MSFAADRGPLALLAVVGPGEPGAVSFGPVGLILTAAAAREATDPAKRHRRICAAALRGPVLPARTGAVFSDLAAARAWAEARAPALVQELAAVAGRAEFVATLRAAASDAPTKKAKPPPATARVAEAAGRALESLSADLAAAAPDLIAARRVSTDPEKGLADLSLLAPRDAGPELRDRILAIRPDAAFTGPWPPYSFAELDL